jgi:outer membrane biosynthesis protein TonB
MASCESSPLVQPVCEWTCDSRKFSIHFAPEVMERLGSESWMAFKSVPHRGLEIGGILLGRKIYDSDATAFWIDGFEAIESEHRSGPSYVLSESDWTSLQAALIKNGEASIGIFRSNTRSERPALQNLDIELFQRCFDSREALFLMVAPAPKVASIFTPTDGSLASVHEFALSSPIASIMGPRQEPPLFQEAETRLPRGLRHLDVPDYFPQGPRSSSDRRRMRALPMPGKEERFLPTRIRDWTLIATTSAAIFALTVGTYSYFHPLQKSAAARAVALAPYEHLHLTVERAGSSLHLLWDRSAPSIRAATHGVLHITDGAYSSEWYLSTALLWTGSFTYQPKTSEETFQLDVYSDAPAGTGVIQVMNPVPQSAASPVKPVASPAPAVPIQPAASPVKALTPVNNTPPPPTPENKDVLPPAAKPPAPKAEAPPNARSAPAAAPLANRPSSLVAATASVPTAGPTVQMSAEPVPGSRVGRIVGKIPLVRRLKRPDRTVLPVPVFQARPNIRLSQDRPVGPVAVNVKVRVAESGAVMLAEVQDYGDPPNWRLAAAALDAARRWTFEPARVEDTAVPSDVILHFRFTP